MWTKNSEGLTKMTKGDVVERHYRNDVMYECYDETDPEHCINIGSFDTREKAAKAAKRYRKSIPNAVIQAYELKREE